MNFYLTEVQKSALQIKNVRSWNESWMNIAISCEWVSAWANWIKMFGALFFALFCTEQTGWIKFIGENLIIHCGWAIWTNNLFGTHTKCARCIQFRRIRQAFAASSQTHRTSLKIFISYGNIIQSTYKKRCVVYLCLYACGRLKDFRSNIFLYIWLI